MILTDKDIAIARSDDNLRHLPWSIRWEDNLEWIADRFQELGYSFYIKNRGEPGRNMSTTLTALKQVRLARKYKEDATRLSAGFTTTLAHELVHAKQPVSIIRYASTRYRFRVELPAYRETIRIRSVQEGLGKTAREKLAHRISDRMRTRYLVGIVDDRAHRAVTDLLLEEARR